MKNKLDERTKDFWTNLFQYYVIVAVAVFVLGGGWGTEEPRRLNLLDGLTSVGIIAIVILGFKIALEFSHEAYLKKSIK